MHADICACAHPHTRACTIFRQRKQDITKFVCLLTSVFVFLRVHCYPYFSVPLQNFQNTFAFQNAGAGWGSNILQCHCSHLSNYSFFIACLMCWPYHPFFYSISRQISTVLSGVCSVVWWLVRIKTELLREEPMSLIKGVCFPLIWLCVCDGGCWQWQWKIPPVAAFIVWQFAYVCFREWQNKRSRADFVVAHESLQCFNPTIEASPKTLIATYTTHKR